MPGTKYRRVETFDNEFIIDVNGNYAVLADEKKITWLEVWEYGNHGHSAWRSVEHELAVALEKRYRSVK